MGQQSHMFLPPQVDNRCSTDDEQGGFRVRRGCVDQIFAVRQVTEKVIEKDKVVYAAFVHL